MHDGMQTVVLVEDEPIVLRSTADLLQEGGFEVVEASSYEEAVSGLEARPEAAALVTDIDLCGEHDGIELAREVAARWPHVRIVIVSGRMRPAAGEYPERAIFFTKPYAPGALLTMVKERFD